MGKQNDKILKQLEVEYKNAKRNEMNWYGKTGIGTEVRYNILKTYLKNHPQT